MSYPAYEETKTMDLRFLLHVDFEDKAHYILQQRWLIRDGIGENAKHSEEWRAVQVAAMGKEQS